MARRANQWIFRIQQEMKSAISAHFITLTYSDNNVPVTSNVDFEGTIQTVMTLQKRDVQLFMKRLRDKQSNSCAKIKYYCAGEYGGRTRRPHYHIILLNAETVPSIQNSWLLGDIYFGEVTPQSIAYTAKYLQKGTITQNDKYTFEIDTREKEFSLMSKKWASVT